jgi:hypothetical protein
VRFILCIYTHTYTHTYTRILTHWFPTPSRIHANEITHPILTRTLTTQFSRLESSFRRRYPFWRQRVRGYYLLCCLLQECSRRSACAGHCSCYVCSRQCSLAGALYVCVCVYIYIYIYIYISCSYIHTYTQAICRGSSAAPT